MPPKDQAMLTKSQALRLLDSFAPEIPRLYPRPAKDYRARVVDAESVRAYLARERHRLAETATLLPDPSIQGAPLLEIGIAYGFLSALLNEDAQWRCQGLELSENIPVYCPFALDRRIVVHPGKLGAKPLRFSDASFHAVILAEVLEHLRLPPRLVFQELKRLLTNGGFLLITTPNFARLANFLKLAAGRNPLEPFPDHLVTEDVTPYLTHIREYTMRELTRLLEQNGFDVRETFYSGCMERGRAHAWISAIVPPWRGSLVVLARK